MDTKRRMRDLGHPVMTSSLSSSHLALLPNQHQLKSTPQQLPLAQPLLPWPVHQRRRIEKLKNDRLQEFERASDENFEWLENYYQGCVYAALQNRDYQEMGLFSRSVSMEHEGSRTSQHFATDQQFDDDAMPFSPYTSGYYSGTGRSTASPDRNSLSRHHRQHQQQRYQQQQQQQQQRQKARYTPKNSPAKFRLKSPKTPNVARIGSPTSPYDRQQHHRQAVHLHTTPRKKLRVTARPSSMRAQRALKAHRKRTASFQKDVARQHRQGQQQQQQQSQLQQPREHQDSGIEQEREQQQQHQQRQEQLLLSNVDDMVRRRDTSPVGLKEPPQRQRQHQKESSRRSSLDLIRKQYNHQDQGMVEQSRHTPTTPAAEERSFKSESDRSFNSEPDKSFIGERSFIAELRASTFKTPARGRSFRSERETSDMDLDDEADEYRSMPGSRARDSMTLKSPVNRSDTSMNQDADLPLRISLGIHSSAPNRSPSVAKRSSDLMDTDRDRLVDAESKRSKSSPFLDTLVPIRFNSPEAESRTGSNSDILTREARAKFGDLSSTASASRSTGRSSAESASRLREPGVESSSAKKRVSDTNMERPIRSTTPTTTPHQRYGYGSAFTEGFAATSEEPTRSAVLRDGVQDGSANADVTRSSYDTAATLRDQVNGGSVEHRMNGVSSSSDSKMNRDSAAQKQAEHTNSHALAENQQDYPPWRQADRTDEEGSSVPANRPGRDEGEQSTRPKPITTTTTVRSEMTAFSSSFTGSSDAGTLRTKPSMTLPEKRTLGTRRPVGTSSNTLTSAFMPPSRLTKITTTNVKSVAGSSVESQVSATIQSDISSAIQTSSSNKITRAGGVQSTAKDAQQSGAEPNGTRPSTMATTSSTSTTGLLGRQGAPSRPPLTSNRVAAESSGVNGTNNGLSRTENQGSNSLRKPFAIPSSTVTAATTSTSKSVFALKKTTIRPVLPDGVPSTLLASSNSSASTRPPGSSLAMMQARIDQHTRESTPTHDAHSKSTRSTTELKTTTTGSSTLSLSSVISSRKESMSTAGNGVRAETQSSSRAAVTTDGGHVFAVPAPVQQPLIPPWDSNFAQPERRHVKTILPEINSDGEDHDPNNPDDPSTSRAKRKKTGVPEWASWEELHRMMESQKNLNPEEIFGPIPMLDVAEIFPGGQKKSSYRPRTSSAHWGASDALTPQEVIKYNEDMGWGSQE